MKVRVTKKCYYQDRIRAKDSFVDFDEDDKDKGVYRAGDKKGQPKPAMPSWAEIVDPKAKEEQAKSEEQPKPTTLHEIAKNTKPNISKPSTKKAKKSKAKKAVTKKPEAVKPSDDKDSETSTE